MSASNLFIFSSNRAIGAFYKQCAETSFLPSCISLKDFFSNHLIVPNKTKIPSFLRPIFLQKASRDLKIEQLGFSKNFLEFLESSPLFFAFFDELSAECVSFDSLFYNDVYAEFEEHLSIIQSLFNAYLNLLLEHNFYDFLPLCDYKILPLSTDISNLIVFLDGFLSRFEINIFKQISQHTPITFKVSIDAFNKEYYQKRFSLETLPYGDCEIQLLEGNFLHLSTTPHKAITYPKVQFFNSKIAQISGIFTHIQLLLQQGVSPDSITLVLPNENLSKYLHLFDTIRNFNYAMGFSLKETHFVEIFKERIALVESWEEVCEILEKLLEEPKFKGFRDSIVTILSYFELSSKYLQDLSLREKIDFFILQLKSIKKDDTQGGRIRVIGILETRGMDLETVIIPDFNQDCVPHRSDKDIFLNSFIREKAGLPTRKDRENLQKHYYARLLHSSKNTFITAIKNEEQSPSNFLNDIRLFGNNIHTNVVYKDASYFFPPYFQQQAEVCEIQAPLNEQKFSATRLTCYLSCLRKFYYKYLQKLEPPQRDERFLRGNIVHLALYECLLPFYQNKQKPKNLLSLFSQQLQAIKEKEQNVTERFDFMLLVLQEELKPFLLHQEKMFENANREIYALELPFETTINGIEFSGKIDRIDLVQTSNGVIAEVIDYKYQKGAQVKSLNKNDLQLAIYAYFLKTQGLLANAFHYYPKQNEIKQIPLEPLTQKLDEITCELRVRIDTQTPINFELTDKKSTCEFCEYQILCNRITQSRIA